MGKHYVSPRYEVIKSSAYIAFSTDAGAISMSSSESELYMDIRWGGYMHRLMFTGSTGFTGSKRDESGTAGGARLGILVFDCSFTKPSPVWLLPGRDVHCGICDIPGTIPWHSSSSPNGVGAGAAAVSSIWWLNDCRMHQFRFALHLISFRDILGCILPSRLSQIIKLHLVMPQPLHALRSLFGGFVHHPAGFVIVAQFALLCLFIVHIFPILPIVGTCKIT